MQWRIRVDTGGTFTDAWAIGPDGVERRAKILSDGTLRCRLMARDGEGWLTDSELVAPDGSLGGWNCGAGKVTASRDGARWLRFDDEAGDLVAGGIIELSCGDEAPVAVARLLTGNPAGQPLPPVDFRVATTRGTNALLERKGATLAFFTTAGFGALPVIRDQRRDRLFDLDQPAPEVLPAFTAAIAGRHDASGDEVVPLDDAALRIAAAEALHAGCTVAAVAFLHSWREPAHELRAGEILRAAGFPQVILSSDVAPLIRLLPRAETAVAESCLTPVMEHFVRRVSEPLGGCEPWLMNSAGGLVPASRFRPRDSLLSGPAGGLVGAAELARAAGFPKVLTFDMGEAIRGVSVREGCDPRGFALLAFGGAGPQHACAVAEKLGIDRVLIPADAGLLSAWGLERARRQEQRVKQILRPFEEAAGSSPVAGASRASRSGERLAPRLQSDWQALAAEVAVPHPAIRWFADLRLSGQDSFLTVEAERSSASAAHCC